jgi:hypothetical protein
LAAMSFISKYAIFGFYIKELIRRLFRNLKRRDRQAKGVENVGFKQTKR